MKKGLLALLVGATLAAGCAAAEAMPAEAVPATVIPAGDTAPGVILVSGGCGFYYHRGPFGGCRPNGGFYRPYGYGYGYRYGYRRPFFPGYGFGYRRF